MWFDRNGWIIVTPIAVVLVIGAGVLRSSHTSPDMVAPPAVSDRLDANASNAGQDRSAYGRSKSETTGSSGEAAGR
jgi:hypothetical protein